MSDMRPSGIAVTVGGVERHVLFTLAVVDEIQSKYGLPVSEVIPFKDKNNENPVGPCCKLNCVPLPDYPPKARC